MTSLQDREEASAVRVSWGRKRIVGQEFGEVAGSEIIKGKHLMVLSMLLISLRIIGKGSLGGSVI